MELTPRQLTVMRLDVNLGILANVLYYADLLQAEGEFEDMDRTELSFRIRQTVIDRVNMLEDIVRLNRLTPEELRYYEAYTGERW